MSEYTSKHSEGKSRAVAEHKTSAVLPSNHGSAQQTVWTTPGNLAIQRACVSCQCGCDGCRAFGLPISKQGDFHEREADSAAAQVMHVTQSQARPPMITPVGMSSSALQRRTDHRAQDGSVPRRSNYDMVAGVNRMQAGGGRPLSEDTRQYFEPRFGRPLHSVRIHTGHDADHSAEALHARAFTLGSHITFNRGEYRPDSWSGRQLLAHELAHVLQQDGENAARIQRSPQGGAQAEAGIKDLIGDDKAPEPGPGAVKFFSSEVGMLTFSTSKPYMRRTVAQLIGRVGLEWTGRVVSNYESGSWMRDANGQAVAQRLREVYTELHKAWKDFSGLVRNAAIARLKMNHAALGDWATYVASLSPGSFMNQAMAAQELLFMESLAARADPQTGQGPFVGPYNMKEQAEIRAWSSSPGRRAKIEMLNRGLINGGCMDCHVEKAISDYDRRFAPDDPARTPPVYRMFSAAQQEAAAGTVCATCHQSSSPVPAAGIGPTDRLGGYVQGSPGLTSIAQSLASIQTKVMPLETQYRVIPSGIINAAVKPRKLVTIVLSHIAARRQGYMDLIAKIAEEDYDFLQLLPVVQTFLGTVDPEVRLMITGAQKASAAAQEARQNVELRLGILAMLLTIFPPTAPIGLALGAGVAAAGLAEGYLDFQHGLMYMQGTGANVFSPEQEAAAGMLMAGGIINMVFSTLSLVGTGVAAGKAILKEPVAGRAGSLPKGVTSYWEQKSYDIATGEAIVEGLNLAPGHIGERATVRINFKTGMGTAIWHGPKGSVTIPIVNGQFQFPAGLLPAAGGAGAAPMVSAAAPAPTLMGPASPPMLTTGQPSLMLPSLTAGPIAGMPPPRPHLGSRVILPSVAPAPGQAPVYVMPLGGREGSQGVRLMNRGLQPRDFPDNGFRGPMLADDPQQLDLWLRAEAKAARSPQDNQYKRWLVAVRDGSVANWSDADLHKAYKVLWDEYKVLARAAGIDVATLHHWNYNKSVYPQQIADPRNLMPIYGKADMSGGYHPAHQGGLHPLTSSSHPTRSPLDPLHRLDLYNYNVPRLNPDYPGMPYGWHPPMRDPTDMPFGWNPLYPPQWEWPGGVPPIRPPR